MLLAALVLALTAVPALAGSGWQATGSMRTAHRAHSAALLADGRVLVISGTGTMPSAEIYDPATGSWTLVAAPLVPRHDATATLLNDGRVLLAGGHAAGGVTTHAELYDPVANTWTATGSLGEPRNRHAAVLLPNGRVLVAGGSDNAQDASATGEVYDPATGTWTLTPGAMSDARENMHAALMANGKVLVAGGFDTSAVPMTYHASADLYDPATNSWSPTGALATPRGQGGTAVLPDGRVLAAGGINRGGRVVSIELYDPVAETWSPGGAIPHGGTRFVTATALDDGRILIHADSNAETALYDPATSLSSVRHLSSAIRGSMSFTVLRDGRVLMAGGDPNPDTAELFTPPTERSATAAGRFGAIPIGVSSERDVTVENSGGHRLWIDGTALAGADAADYEIVADDCTGAELLPGQRCVVRVRFTPSAAGARAAELTFDDNAEQSPAFVLDGSGPEPEPEPEETDRLSPPAPPRSPAPEPPAPPAPPVPAPPVTRPAPRRALRAPAIERFALAQRCVRPATSGSRVRVGLDLKLTRKARVRIEVSRAIGTWGMTACPPRGSRARFRGDLEKPLVRARGTTRMAMASSVMQRHMLTLRLRPALYRITVRPYTGPGRVGRPAHRWLRVLAP